MCERKVALQIHVRAKYLPLITTTAKLSVTPRMNANLHLRWGMPHLVHEIRELGFGDLAVAILVNLEMRELW